MFFELELALAALPEIGVRTRARAGAAAAGPGDLCCPTPRGASRWPAAPSRSRLGLRVPQLDGELAPLAAMRWPVLQSSANPSRWADPRSLEEVDAAHPPRRRPRARRRRAAGTPSTVVDLTPTRTAAASRSCARAPCPQARRAGSLCVVVRGAYASRLAEVPWSPVVRGVGGLRVLAEARPGRSASVPARPAAELPGLALLVPPPPTRYPMTLWSSGASAERRADATIRIGALATDSCRGGALGLERGAVCGHIAGRRPVNRPIR